jgi:hypothetical protein
MERKVIKMTEEQRTEAIFLLGEVDLLLTTALTDIDDYDINVLIKEIFCPLSMVTDILHERKVIK